jgi:hypothetical protein
MGAKPPLRPKHDWSIRTKLQIGDRKPDLARFNLAIDSKLRGCDVVALKVEDVLHTETPLNARLCARKRPACRCGSRSPNKPGKQSTSTSSTSVPRIESPAPFCSLRRAGRATGLSTRQCARLVSGWILPPKWPRGRTNSRDEIEVPS